MTIFINGEDSGGGRSTGSNPYQVVNRRLYYAHFNSDHFQRDVVIIVSVSYTHLDVYKRQVYTRYYDFVFWNDVRVKLFICILLS